MPPILHLMRHGQGYHSAEVTKDGHLLHDPELTPKGVEQCKARCAAFDRHDHIDLLLASPLRRAIQTTTHAFSPSIARRGLRIIALPAAEEVSSDPSDTGSSASALRSQFGDELVDYSYLSSTAGGDDGWFEHVGDFSSEAQAVHARAEALRRWIRDRPETEVVLVSHGYFAHYLTHEVDAQGKQTTAWWGEAELRTYRFEEDASSGEGRGRAVLVETEESKKRRGGDSGDGAEEGEKRVILNLPWVEGRIIH